jgi:hypothetical protein
MEVAMEVAEKEEVRAMERSSSGCRQAQIDVSVEVDSRAQGQSARPCNSRIGLDVYEFLKAE